MNLVHEVLKRTTFGALVLCPGCRQTVKPLSGPNGRACPKCGTTWQPRREGLLRVIRGKG